MNETIDTPAPESKSVLIPVVLTTLAAIGAVTVIKKTADYAHRFALGFKDGWEADTLADGVAKAKTRV